MLVLGLLVIAVGAVLVIGGVFATGLDGGDLEFLGVGVSPTVVFVLGLVAGVALLFGASLTKFGAKRELRHRKEQRKLDELSEKLDRAESERRRDLDDDPDLRR
jgi:hypothetical protein